MMQQVASTKADVAAFATLQGVNEQAEPSSAFEQVLKQQQNTAPATNPAHSSGPKVKGEVHKPAREIEHKTTNTQQTDKSAESRSTAVLQTQDDAQQSVAVSQQQRSDISTKNDSQPKGSTLDKFEQDELTPLNEKNDEQILIKSTEQWIDLVWSLQELSIDAAQSDDAEVVNPLEVDSIEALQDWLQPLDDKLQALLQLIDAKPQVQSWLAEADLSQNAELKGLLNQALLLRKANILQGEGVVDNSQAIGDTLKQDLLALGKDIAALLKNNRLSPQDIELLNQALVKSMQENSPLSKEANDLLQIKQGPTPIADKEASQKVKLIRADMPIIFVPQKDEAGNIQEASTAKIVQSEHVSKADLQALLDKISGINKTSTESNADIKISRDSQTSQEVPLAGNPSSNDKTNLAKDSTTLNSPAVVSPTAVEKIIVSNTELKGLLVLSTDELESALNTMAQRIAKLLGDEKLTQSAAPNKIISDLGTLAATSSKDIVAALKAGVAEFKDQLAAGHEPGLDLKALVTQALDKTGDSAVAVKVANDLDKAVRTLSQSLASISQINDMSSISQALNTAVIDSQVTQAEQNKAMQFNQFDNKLEKALNLHKPESHQQLADKVRWMVNTGNLIAEIRLDPAELGSVHVKVSLSAESATVNFVVQSQQARDALETATPKLREMLAEKGIELGQSTVKQDSQAKQDGQTDKQARNGSVGLATSDPLHEEDTLLTNNNRSINGSSNVIDYFV
ncbi:flagellar hook-length control protein FliK [Paraglaciecola sp.]|uniref:flagellar hook-length control protein FliK n=1 Tax=Paraglaciecola sp. TaxID=1920173 RepID=UPI0030F4666F